MSTKQPSVCCSQKTNLDRANEGGWTPLMYASYIGHETVVQQLLEAGVSVNSTNNKGQSPLALATSCGNDKTAELLLKVSGSHTRMRGLARTHTHTHTHTHRWYIGEEGLDFDICPGPPSSELCHWVIWAHPSPRHKWHFDHSSVFARFTLVRYLLCFAAWWEVSSQFCTFPLGIPQLIQFFFGPTRVHTLHRKWHRPRSLHSFS